MVCFVLALFIWWFCSFFWVFRLWIGFGGKGFCFYSVGWGLGFGKGFFFCLGRNSRVVGVGFGGGVVVYLRSFCFFFVRVVGFVFIFLSVLV